MARAASKSSKQSEEGNRSPFLSEGALERPLVGHSVQQKTFRESVSSGCLHHGWLLHGPKGIGKARFALQAAAYLAAEGARQEGGGLRIEADHPDARLIAQNAHPDAIWIDRLTGLTGGKKLPKTIPVATVRDGLHKLQSTAAYGGWRTLVVDAVDDLNAEGANALLKPLEEPPRKTVLFLIAHRLSAVLPTLRSRCRLMAFSRLSEDELGKIAFGAQPDAVPEQMHDVARALADGRAGVVQDLLAEPELLEAYGQFCMQAARGSGSLPDRLAFASFLAALDDTGRSTMLGLMDDWFSRRVRGQAEPSPLPTPDQTLDLSGRRSLAELWSELGKELSIRRAINLDISERIMALFAGLDRVYSEGQA